jgi:hypothetical protein
MAEKEKEFQLNKRFTRRLKSRRIIRARCDRTKCVKESKEQQKLLNITQKKIPLHCNKKPCDDMSACIDKHPELSNLKFFEFLKKSSKLCPVKKCDEYYECTHKLHQKTGSIKAASKLSECREKKCHIKNI